MDQQEILKIIGDLYIRNHVLLQEIEKKNKELDELRNIIISLQNKNAPISS